MLSYYWLGGPFDRFKSLPGDPRVLELSLLLGTTQLLATAFDGMPMLLGPSGAPDEEAASELWSFTLVIHSLSFVGKVCVGPFWYGDH